MAWTEACTLGTIPRGGAHLFTAGSDRVALFRLDDDALYAIDDRCPHEGYPLTQGALSGCTLTCCWHNYKFDLRDGRCLLGEEDVRTYPVRVRDGRVEVDLTPPDPATVQPRLWASLGRALDAYRMGQAARDVVRLLGSGVAPARIALFGAAWDADRAEYGCSHALPVAADVLHWLPTHPGAQAAIPLVQALDMAAESCVRRPPRPRPDPVAPGDPATFSDRLRALVEAEDVAAAEALLRGALGVGFGRDCIEQALYRLCADHFLDYGHALIYQVKVFDLLDATSWDDAAAVLPGHLVGIVLGTREDVLPAWTGYRRRLAAVVPELPSLGGQSDAVDRDALGAAVLDGRGADAFAAVLRPLQAHVDPVRIAEALCLAAAERLLRFDDRHDRDRSVQDNWLSATHVQTFCNAVRQAQTRMRGPDRLRLLFQAARMIQMTRPLDLPADERFDTAPIAGDLAAAVAARRAREAVGIAAGTPPEAVRGLLMELAVADPAVRPIVVAHFVKQIVAAWDDHRATGSVLPLLAVVRLVASPVSERRIRRVTEEAIRFVTEGRVPRTLVP